MEQAVKANVRVTLSMGAQPTTRLVGGKEVLAGQLVLPSGAGAQEESCMGCLVRLRACPCVTLQPGLVVAAWATGKHQARAAALIAWAGPWSEGAV